MLSGFLPTALVFLISKGRQMSDKEEKSLNRIFNSASKNVPIEREALPKNTRTVADKDNAEFRHDVPNKDQRPASNLAPAGMSGVSSPPNTVPPITEKIFVEFTPEGFDEVAPIDLSNDGSLVDGKTAQGFNFLIKQEEKSFSNGLDGGRISRLTLLDENGEAVCHFENRWHLPADTPEKVQSVHDLNSKFGEVPRKAFRSFGDMNPDKNHDIDL